jgi:ubiquinone/menaquinone biosynthesis C-methylase UbiE
MERTPEPELMETAEQAEAYAKADFDAPNAAFVERVLTRFPTLDGELVDLGCGPADIPIRLAKARATLHVTAIDGSKAMLARAADAVKAAGLDARITLVEGVLPGTLRSTGRFDAVTSNSLLHHLADPGVLWREIKTLAKPGAAIYVGDLYRPATTEDARRIVETYSASEPAVLKTDFFNSLCAAFTLEELRAQLEAEGLASHLNVEATSDRHVAIHGFLPH